MKKAIFYLGFCGVLFSGYLSSVKLFSKTCALRESCPLFFGHPACYFGFGLFFAIFLFAALIRLNKIPEKFGMNFVMLFSLLGILFAGNFTVKELPVLSRQGLAAFTLGLPSCAYGLLFFLSVFAISAVAKLRARKVNYV